jgi:hypothetical protein
MKSAIPPIKKQQTTALVVAINTGVDRADMRIKRLAIITLTIIPRSIPSTQ